ncbi:hypothetical protein HUA76_37685 [Myxococcus sp. CA056]|uniref:hypothetical protein n=1 Tax=unclassified Myxococcus TaxID=2648731 RepID=UPI00157B9ED3|nr:MULTISPECIES: hypothetical protein [unclassified Myxococcus]NTX16520.1 hypothetical protein [Myxococcus sp. CA056]NTX57426.1 hypothetical protein [Myxococcus sp. CA039A]
MLEPLAALHRRSAEDQAIFAARDSLSRLGLGDGDFTPVVDDPEASQGNKDNDQAFAIVRVEGRVVPLLVHSTLHGFVTLLDEALTSGTDLEPEAWGRLRHAYSVLFDMLLDRPVDREGAAALPPPRSTASGERDALRRWTRGHYVFMSLVQGMVVVLHVLREDVEAGNLEAARSDLERVTALMNGAEVALRFTGDYSYTAYEKSVRPTLMPPVAPPGMTGLRWRDHEYMVKVLAGLRPIFAGLPVELEEAREAFYQSVARAYDAHKTVCASFVGTERTSLLMAERTEKSAVELLEHFKRVRLHLIKE